MFIISAVWYLNILPDLSDQAILPSASGHSAISMCSEQGWLIPISLYLGVVVQRHCGQWESLRPLWCTWESRAMAKLVLRNCYWDRILTLCSASFLGSHLHLVLHLPVDTISGLSASYKFLFCLSYPILLLARTLTGTQPHEAVWGLNTTVYTNPFIQHLPKYVLTKWVT